jgi:hypothetical protein
VKPHRRNPAAHVAASVAEPAAGRGRTPVEVHAQRPDSPNEPGAAPAASSEPANTRSDPLATWLDRAESLLSDRHAGVVHGPRSERTSGPDRVRTLAQRFALDFPEIDALSLAALSELRPDRTPNALTVARVVAALGEPAWQTLAAHAPLRRWRLLELGPADRFIDAVVRIDERVLMYLAGVDTLDDTLRALVSPLPGNPASDTHDTAMAGSLARAWQAAHARAVQTGPHAEPPHDATIVLVRGTESRRKAVGGAMISALGLQPWLLSGHDIPAAASDRERLARLLERETALAGLGLVIDAEREHSRQAIDLARRLGSPAIVTSDDADPGASCALYRLDADAGVADIAAWRSAAGPQLADEDILRLHSEFRLAPDDLADVAARIATGVNTDPARNPAAELASSNSARSEPAQAWQKACIQVATARLERVASCTDPRATLDRLVLPAAQRRLIDDLLRRVRWRSRVLDQWGYRSIAPSRGISAMLTGASGTGKSFAAEALAHELGLKLCRIDLASVVSKYIGETEKQLSRIFDAAEAGGAVLLFDEADALFGKRTELRDSHDRYANIEVAYLLQRLERSGIVLLTTNFKQNVDPAFLRRLDVVIDFPFPTVEARRRLWELAIPTEAPRHAIDLDKLAQLHVSGGAIRNIALTAAYLAGERGDAVTMQDMLEAARLEALKHERSLSDRETRGWTP